MKCMQMLLIVFSPSNFQANGNAMLDLDVLQPQGTKEMYGVREGSLRPQDCGPRCTSRCSATSYKKPCMFFCQKCCAKCLCVPPGMYGNKQMCPCYNNWKTKRGGPKCP